LARNGLAKDWLKNVLGEVAYDGNCYAITSEMIGLVVVAG
jgi:hypothetical protein